MSPRLAAFLLLAASAVAAPGRAATVERIGAAPAGTQASPLSIGGRAAIDAATGTVAYQWPGVYFESAFEGDQVDFGIGPGKVILHVQADGVPLATLDRPATGFYRIAGLGPGPHRVRIDVATESQAGPNRFDGFFAPPDSRAIPVAAPARAIEFIGDSHTVGYGNRSPRRECTEDEVWATTDTTLAYGPRVARHFGAGYRVNAISGRGIVRNYGGMAADTLPQAYPYLLFDRATPDAGEGWDPRVIVVALGTNDFSTPLHPGEPWPDRAALRADYARTYVAFVQSLRARHPRARIVLWSTDLFDGEIRAGVEDVLARLRAAGETRTTYLAMTGLRMDGCHAHPSLADHERIATALVAHIDALPVDWDG
ncbi:SGNH/GDSL hydrolase family protein [Pseudoxanthomonas sp. 10H]|uniref:SGNH/GDSL hydrolase family protein n=1 Tax=Pseudoxanthomonas sp. 10H TaxID=3242729 RepID=UPI0035585160